MAPLLSHRLRENTTFHPETVPAFSATATFNKMRQRYPAYGYKEATLNPTNLEDRASDWESDVIRLLREHPELKQITGERESANGRSLYLRESDRHNRAVPRVPQHAVGCARFAPRRLWQREWLRMEGR